MVCSSGESGGLGRKDNGDPVAATMRAGKAPKVALESQMEG